MQRRRLGRPHELYHGVRHLVATIAATTNVNHFATHSICQGDFYARAQISPGSCSSLKNETHTTAGGTSAFTTRNCDGLFYYTAYSTNGQHGGFGEGETTSSSPDPDIVWTPPPPCEPPGGGCPLEGSIWQGEPTCECSPGCPLLLDTTGRGFGLTSAAAGVRFDLNVDGTRGQLAWTDPNRANGLLAFDRNGNGAIDDGEELFGNFTPLEPFSPDRAEHGFDALAALESDAYGPSVIDGVIDTRDAAYRRLLVWVDGNHDGISQPEELRTAASIGLVALETAYGESRRRDRFGNQYRLRGISWWRVGGDRTPQPRIVYDVWLAAQ